MSLPGVHRAVSSRWYSSAPYPPSNQPRYVNAAVWAETDLQPRAMLAALQSIEARLGRVRSVPNAARTIDLDIIDMGGLVLDEPDLILPHPRAHVRRFVLVPLRDVAPRWRHPGSGRSVSELLDELEMDDLTPL